MRLGGCVYRGIESSTRRAGSPFPVAASLMSSSAGAWKRRACGSCAAASSSHSSAGNSRSMSCFGSCPDRSTWCWCRRLEPLLRLSPLVRACYHRPGAQQTSRGARMPDRYVVFSHGQGSGPWGEKITAMAEMARSEGFEAESVDYQGIDDPNDRVTRLLSFCKDLRGSLVLVGSSLGGHVATAAGTRTVSAGARVLHAGLRAANAQARRVPDHYRARLARRRRAGGKQRALREATQGDAAHPRRRSSPGREHSADQLPVRIFPDHARAVPVEVIRAAWRRLQWRSRMARAARRSISEGATSLTQRAIRPRSEVSNSRLRFSIAGTTSSAHCCAVMMRSWRIGL